jgi:hypothetical protein
MKARTPFSLGWIGVLLCRTPPRIWPEPSSIPNVPFGTTKETPIPVQNTARTKNVDWWIVSTTIVCVDTMTVKAFKKLSYRG